MFITKKVYAELVESRDKWKDLAIRIQENNKRINRTSEETLQVAKEVNDDNKKIVAHCKQLKSELEKLKTPCDLCKFSPPSSTDGNPCSICPAQAKGGAE